MNPLSFTEEYINQVDFDRAVALYKERFANPADFTFIFVGNYNEKTITNYINLYLGSLKTNQSKKEQINTSVFKPISKESSNENVYFGTEQQGWLGLNFISEAEYNQRNNMISTFIGEALDIYLVNIIREKMGGVYSPMAQVSLSKYPTPRFQTFILLGCNPENTDVLTNACIKILNDLKKKGIDKKTLAKVKKQLISAREKNIQTNEFWLSYLNGRVMMQDNNMNAVNEYTNLVNSITNKDIVEFLNKYLNTSVYSRVNLYPESMLK